MQSAETVIAEASADSAVDKGGVTPAPGSEVTQEAGDDEAPGDEGGDQPAKPASSGTAGRRKKREVAAQQGEKQPTAGGAEADKKTDAPAATQAPVQLVGRLL